MLVINRMELYGMISDEMEWGCFPLPGEVLNIAQGRRSMSIKYNSELNESTKCPSLFYVLF